MLKHNLQSLKKMPPSTAAELNSEPRDNEGALITGRWWGDGVGGGLGEARSQPLQPLAWELVSSPGKPKSQPDFCHLHHTFSGSLSSLPCHPLMGSLEVTPFPFCALL